MSDSATDSPHRLVPTPDGTALASPSTASTVATRGTVECPVCGGAVELGDEGLLLGELLDCLECASELEVTALAPLVLAEAPMAAEDWGE